jgi:hypothetical protein
MAEYLVFWKAHYMDSWDQAKVDSLTPVMRAKYDRRYQKGDIVEVREDGYWDKRGFDKEAFIVVKVPGVAVDAEKAKPLVLNELSSKPTTLKRSQWNVSQVKLPKDKADAIDAKGTKALALTLTEKEATDCMERKL